MWMRDKEKHTNLPISVLKDIQVEGWCGYNNLYIDMDVSDPAVFLRLSPLRSKGLWRRLVARCGSVHPETDGLCLGIGPGDFDPAGVSTLGWRIRLRRTNPHAVASQRG
jgi:hypothetical protein